MGQRNQRFNYKTLQFEEKPSRFMSILKKSGIVFAVSLMLATSMSYAFMSLYKTPAYVALESKNKELLLQYENLNEKLGVIEGALDQIQDRDDDIYRTIFSSDPIPESVRKAGFGGVALYEDLEQLDEKNLVASTTKRIDILSKQTYIQAKSYQEVLDLAINREKELSSIPAILPLAPNDLLYTSSGFGHRVDPVYKTWNMHAGIDFVAEVGTPVYATGDGVVERVRSQRTGHGKHVVVNHGFGYVTYYSHLNGFNVKKGQKINRGDVIGYVGSTGKSTGPHLHYEIQKDRRAVNPVNYFFKDLDAEQYQDMVTVSSSVGRSLD